MHSPYDLSPSPLKLVVENDEKGMRLDQFLTKRFPDCSRTYFHELIARGDVQIHGKITKKRTPLQEGALITVLLSERPQIMVEPEPMDLNILFEDEVLIAINKPSGLVVHPGAGNPSHTLANGLLYHCQELKQWADPLRPGIVHRLDKETSGVMIAAKTSASHAALSQLFANREIEKEYHAVCVGTPQTLLIDKPIGRDTFDRKRFCISSKGKEALTRIEVIEHGEILSLIKAFPKTGRTHQIRVHLTSQKTPILGDSTYGNAKVNTRFKAERQLLHAKRLSFIHPFSKKTLSLEAPYPEDMEHMIKKISAKELCEH